MTKNTKIIIGVVAAAIVLPFILFIVMVIGGLMIAGSHVASENKKDATELRE